jgi:rare lipoprotein A
MVVGQVARRGPLVSLAAVALSAILAGQSLADVPRVSGGWVTTIVRAHAMNAAGVARPASLSTSLHGLEGIASYYWQDQMTASGERFNKRAMTAAHKTLPLGTMVRVRHAVNGREVLVRINDRGPFVPGRVIDLSQAAAETLGMTATGLARVRLDVVR